MKVLLFARAKDLIGADHVEIEVAAATTIGEVRRVLLQRYPRLTGLVEKSAFAVNDEYANDGTVIPAGAEVALLPPVSGG